MFKKHIINSAIVIFFIFILSSMSLAQAAIVDVKNLDKGVISLNYKKNIDGKKLLISKDGQQEHFDLKPKTNYSLRFGNGRYTVSVLEHVKGNQYRVLSNENVSLNLKDEKEQFLQSTYMVDWNRDMLAIRKAKDLTKDAKSDEEKVKIIYDYITKNIRYDKVKAKTVKPGYLPSIDETINSQLGICYDYAVLTAAMLRSLDIPTKLVMGDKSDIDVYHAWNEVYLNGKWTSIDTTYDAAYVEKNVLINMIKDNNDYRIEKVY